MFMREFFDAGVAPARGQILARSREAARWIKAVWLICLLPSLLLSAYAQTTTRSFGNGINQFTMEFVPIGNPNNPADTTGTPNPVGSVPYTYNLGKQEVSRDMINKANTAGGLGITMADMSRWGGDGVNRPATGITWNEAATYVNWLNTSTGGTPAYKFVGGTFTLWSPGDAGYNPSNQFRNSRAKYVIASNNEWYKGAYGNRDGTWNNYATGSDSAPTAVASGTTANTAVYSVQGPADITSAGGLSPYETMGQSGNVWEWNETGFDGINNTADENREVRGGTWGSVSDSLGASVRFSYSPTFEWDDIGFRVVVISDFNSTINNGEVTITGYTGTGGLVEIPATIGGLPVTTIGEQAFLNNLTLIEVVIPIGVTTIGAEAFAGCREMELISLPSSLTTIGETAFQNCEKLNNVIIPEGVTSLGKSAFQSCTNLDSVTLPTSLTHIKQGTFAFCPKLTTISIPSAVDQIDINAFYGSKVAVVNFEGPYPPQRVDLLAFNSINDPAGAIGYYPATASANWSRVSYSGITLRSNDQTAPVITLIGANPLEIYKGGSFSDPGATVTDNVDAIRTITGSGTVNTATVGNNTLTYNTTDAAGNQAVQVTRTVVVKSIPATITLSAASGSYTLLQGAVPLDDSLTVSGGETFSGATIQIETGFVAGDTLNLTPSASFVGITGNYNATKGILTLSGSGDASKYQSALRAVTFSTTSTSTVARGFKVTLGSAISFGGHYYEYVPGSYSWGDARTVALSKTFNGLSGYLANLTSADENNFVKTKIGTDVWIGGSDKDTEGVWKWMDGPEANQTFWNGLSGGSAPSGKYANWNTGEPNNAGDEDYAQFFVTTGKWNDLPIGSRLGFLVEYGTDTPAIQTFSGTRTFSVTKATQTITGLAATDGKIYGAVDYTLSVTKGASTSALTYASSAPGVATIDPNGLVSIKGAGTTTLTVNQAADANYNAASTVTQTLTVGKASLTIRADDKSRGYGAANPALTGSVVGAVRGESFTVTASTTATATSTPGSYSIEPDVTGAGNYTVSKINGSLTVTSAPFAGADAFTAAPAPSASTKYSFAQLLANDRTYSGTTLSITGVAPIPGVTQGTVSTKGSWVVYVPKAGAPAGATDSFSYTLSNGTSTRTTGTATISLVSPDMTIEVALVSPATPANAYKATFLVMPGLVFEAYGSDTPDGTYTKIGSTWTSASSGKLEVTDTAAAGKSSRFYKLKWVP